jgi:hypothetical protein
MSDISKALKPAAKMLAQLHPVLAVLDVAWSELARERNESYLEIIAARGVDLSAEELAKNKELLHANVLTMRVVQNTHRKEKIERLASLFANFVRSGNFSLIDRYEESLKILDDLSENEFQILLLLQSFESKNPPKKLETAPDRIQRYWNDFVDECQKRTGIDSTELRGRIERIKRTGLIQSPDGIYTDGGNPFVFLTQLYSIFLDHIDQEVSPQWILVSENTKDSVSLNAFRHGMKGK